MINGKEKPDALPLLINNVRAVNVPLIIEMRKLPAEWWFSEIALLVPRVGMGIPGEFSRASALAAAIGLAAGVALATPAISQTCAGNPDAIGTSRVIAIDPADYPRVGTLNYRQTLPLEDHEVVLTFDDGPLPPYSTRVLDVLQSQCVKATFFLVGEMARAFPATVQRIYQDGHTIGTHSEHHPLRMGQLPIDKMRFEVDQGIVDVGAALGDPGKLAPFFRIPGFARSNILEDELAARHLAVFSTDTVEDDWHRHITAKQIIALALSRLEKRGKGILLLHDIHPWTAEALPGLLKQLKDNGFRIVQVVPAGPGMPETVVPAAPDMRVAWTSAQQEIIDDSGNAPIWPALSAGLQPEQVALVAPDVDVFATHYLLAPAAIPGTVQTATAAGEDVLVPLRRMAWPDQREAALNADDPQLPAPSIADIGWPVQPQILTDETEHDLRQSANRTRLFVRGRHSQVRSAKHDDRAPAKTSSAKPTRLSRANAAKPNGASPAKRRDAKLTPKGAAPHHARAPAAADKHASLAPTLATLIAPAH
jgi:peptidoglycan-N-acetylglucosamine deacetylase